MEDSHITVKIINKAGNILSETTCEITEKNLTCLITGLKKVQKEVNAHLTGLIDGNDSNQAVETGEEEEESSEDEEDEEEKDQHCVKKLKTK
ncbi:hypothetical protein J437_LFUL006159 [Ladona fulva]|uniref:Uncharacterized protein n=1 Tax=Ladona fulva TaxID=123851 RepID=A0A8K0K0J4_LADFU|nr:hypothetical protein J437_LFUL006159 [Ladona fulva]